MEKVKKKKVSLSSQIKSLRERNKGLSERNAMLCNRWDKFYREYNLIIDIIPLNYYKITFKMLNNNGDTAQYCELHKGINIRHAIHNLCNNKTHPSTFEMVDFKELGK